MNDIDQVTCWQLKTKALTFGRMPALMGIVNVTPDSFSDGGQFFDTSRAVDHALELVGHGADILDIGGESTRPYSDQVAVDEELRRVIPVIQRLCDQTAIPISIDTSKSVVAQEAIAAGAEIINDVTGLTGDPKMLETAVNSAAGLCVMHMQGTPRTMQDAPAYKDLVAEICDYLANRRDSLVSAGIARERICLDPGIGFGKTHEHNLRLIAESHQFHRLGCPLLVGHSRKGFLAKLLGDNKADRTQVTVGVALGLARAGIHLLRIHDVRSVREALIGFAAAGGLD